MKVLVKALKTLMIKIAMMMAIKLKLKSDQRMMKDLVSLMADPIQSWHMPVLLN